MKALKHIQLHNGKRIERCYGERPDNTKQWRYSPSGNVWEITGETHFMGDTIYTKADLYGTNKVGEHYFSLKDYENEMFIEK